MASRAASLSILRAPKRITIPAFSNSKLSLAPANRTVYKVLLSTSFRAIHSYRHLPRIQHPISLRRHISTSPTLQDSAVQSFPDPDRPDLFYHLFAPPSSLSSTDPVFALSFLSTPPPNVVSPSVIGWLPASGQGDGAGLNDFVENERFKDVLHEAIRSALTDGVDEIQKNGAIQTREGWMHIHDCRNIPPLGRIGDPDDIIGSVRVENGEILADTYQPMPSYRVCTTDGVLQLTDGLASRLLEVLQAHRREGRT